MFSKIISKIGRFEIISVRNEQGAGIDLVPALGGAIHQIYFTDKAIPVLDPFIDGEDLELNPRYKQALLFPFPNRLRDGKYAFEKVDYQFPINEPENNNALHGFLYNKELHVSEVILEKSNAEVRLTYDYHGEFEYYPFPCSITLLYKFTIDSLIIDFKIKNTGSTALPYGFGWHPYFKSDAVLQLAVPESELQPVDNRNLPIKEEATFRLNTGFQEVNQELDNCFKLAKKGLFTCVIGMFGGNKIVLKADESVRFFQIYTPSMSTVAIEPVTCNIDALNSRDGLIQLKSQAIRTHQIQLSIA
jgi:aldose 1-epimerase